MRAEELLADVDWLRRLARRLVADDAVADDLVQEAWIAAAHKAPEARESRRPWLRKVLRDLWHMRLRGERRRDAREEASRVFAAEVPTPEELVARAETGRLLAELVLELDEPLRGTVLLHFHEGLSLAEIARAHDIPAGTVRWRLKTALDRVRERLDRRAGERRQWVAALCGFSRGVIMAERQARRIGIIVAIALLLVAVGGALVGATRWAGGTGGGGDPPVVVAPASAPRAAPEAPPVVAKPRMVVGQVVAAGRPFAGATVTLAAIGGEQRTTSDGAGRFTLAAPRQSSHAVATAAAPGYSAATAVVVAGDARELVLELQPCTVTMFGTVTDAAGTPLAGAIVRRVAPRQEAPFGPATRTDGAGRYELCAPRGTLELSFAASGFGAVRMLHVAHGRHRLDATLVPEGTVVGRVTDAQSGEPLADVPVALWPATRAAAGPEMAMGISDADGRFQIDGVAPGRYRVGARSDEHVASGPLEISVAAAAVGEPLDIALEPAARVEGVVLRAGVPVAGARVRLSSHASPSFSDETVGDGVVVAGPDGRFSLGGRRLGAAYVVEVGDHLVVAPQRPLAVDRPLVGGVVVEVASGGVIAGAVRARNGDPAPRARVTLTGMGARTIDADGAGRFALRGLTAGRWTLRAAAADGTAASTLTELELAADQRRDDVTLVVDRAAFIAGVLVDEHGRPVEDAEVTTTGPVGTMDVAMAITTPDGRFELGPLVGGTAYTLLVHPLRGARTTLPPADGRPFVPVAVADGGSRVDGVRLAVRAGSSELAGVVVDGQGKPLADVTVRASPEPQPGVAFDVSDQTPWPAARSEADGRFRLAVRGATTFTVEAHAGHGAPARLAGVAAGARGIELRVTAPGAIRGVLRGFTDGAIVTARSGDTSHLARVARGGFSIDGLGAGRYRLSAIDDALATASAEIEVRGGALARIELTAAPPGRVHGRAVHADGVPAPGLRCAAYPYPSAIRETARGPLVATTDADGGFAFAALPAARFMIRCGADPWHGLGGLTFVTVEPGADAEVEIDVRRH